MKVDIIFSQEGTKKYETDNHQWDYVKNIETDMEDDNKIIVTFDTKNPKHSIMLFGSERTYKREEIKRIELLI